MNQFKKAKQLRNETGQATESITDLKTAGVTQKQENTEIATTIEKEAPLTDTNNNTAIDTKTNDSEVSTQLPINNSTNTTPIVVEPSIIETTKENVDNQTVVQSTANIPTPEVSYENTIPTVIPSEPPAIVNNTIHEPLNTAPQTITVPMVNEATQPVYTAPVEYKNNISTIETVQPYKEPQPTQEITTPKHSKSTKKSVPNIFAPKGEAKSMRKSLVLKPTSVKIAENYCEKNGGSFNELIQTLLDNFIDEYGL